MAEISIIIPVYNVENYLPTCLDSVLAQTFQDWEAICINDGSSDKCSEILTYYSSKDNRIKMITQKNQGLSMARNNGMKHATGSYIYFLDSDDFIHPQLLEICYKLAKKENAEMVSFSFHHYNEGEPVSTANYNIEQIKYILTTSPLHYQRRHHNQRVYYNVWSKLFKKSFIDDIFFIKNITYEDYPYIYAILGKHPRSVLLNTPFYYYRINPNSISNSNFCVKNIKDYHTGLNFIIKMYEHACLIDLFLIKIYLFPNILKHQWNRILKSPKEAQTELYKAFAEELRDLHQKGWLKFWGHKLSRYWKYKKLIKK